MITRSLTVGDFARLVLVVYIMHELYTFLGINLTPAYVTIVIDGYLYSQVYVAYDYNTHQMTALLPVMHPL